MYIATIPNRNSPPAILLREGYREDGKVKTRTLANLSKLPPEAIAVLRQVLEGKQMVPVEAMDWLLTQQPTIEKKLAARHLANNGVALYDLSSSYFEGVTCPLAEPGFSRDGKKGKLQVNYGLLTNPRGVPVAVSVFKGSTGDPRVVNGSVLCGRAPSASWCPVVPFSEACSMSEICSS
jgi:hypothetical protein